VFNSRGNGQRILREEVLLKADQLQEKYYQYFMKSLQNKNNWSL
jgi:hypothetical protein